jgi:hypothetical protein
MTAVLGEVNMTQPSCATARATLRWVHILAFATTVATRAVSALQAAALRVS